MDAAWRVLYRVAHRGLRAWWFLRRPELRGAHVAVWHGEELLLIRTSYRREDCVPSGYIEPGEEPVEAARRELAEEVGISATTDALVATQEFELRHYSARNRTFFWELRLAERPPLEIDRREIVWAGFVAARDLPSRNLVPELRRYLELQGAARGPSH